MWSVVTPAPSDPSMAKRIVWDQTEKRYLGRLVARHFVQQEWDRPGLDLRGVRKRMMAPLREAVFSLQPHRQREVGGPAHVKWLGPMVLEMLAAHRGEPSKYPADILAWHRGEEVIAFRREAPEEEPQEPEPEPAPPGAGPPKSPEDHFVSTVSIDRIELPEGYTVVPEIQWRRALAYMRDNRRLVLGLADEVHTLIDLFMDIAPQLMPPAEHDPIAPGSLPGRGTAPMVGVAGLRPRDQRVLEERAGEEVELVFVDCRRRRPLEVGQVDWMVVSIHAGKSWVAEARRVFAGRLSVVNSVSTATQAIERLLRP